MPGRKISMHGIDICQPRTCKVRRVQVIIIDIFMTLQTFGCPHVTIAARIVAFRRKSKALRKNNRKRN